MVDLDLKPQQKNVIGAALTLLALAVIVAVSLFFLTALGKFFAFFSHVFVPLGTAGILALMLRPFYEWIRVRTGKIPVLAVGVVFATIILPLAGCLWFFGDLLVGQVQEMIKAFPALGARFMAWVQKTWPDLQPVLEERQDVLLKGLQEIALSAWSAGVTFFGAMAGLLGWLVLPVYLAFFLMAPPFKVDDLEKLLPFLKESLRRDILFLVKEFVDILVSFFRGQMVIALIQGLLFAVGFSLVGLRFGFVLGLLLGLMNIIPYLGNIVGLSICLPLALFQDGGGWGTLSWVVGVFAVVQVVEGYVLTPRIMGNRTGLHPLAIIVAIFFWGTALSGISGMLLAIPLTAFLVVFWRLAREKYIHEWV